MKSLEKIDRIAVLVSVGHHRVSGVSCYSRNDAAALEIARTLAAQHLGITRQTLAKKVDGGSSTADE